MFALHYVQRIYARLLKSLASNKRLLGSGLYGLCGKERLIIVHHTSRKMKTGLNNRLRLNEGFI